MTSPVTPYFDPNMMPPWLRGGGRLNMGGVLGMPPNGGAPGQVQAPPMGRPGNALNIQSLLQGQGPGQVQAAMMPPEHLGAPGGPPIAMPPRQIAPMRLPQGGAPVNDPGLAGPYWPGVSMNLNPFAGGRRSTY